MPREFAALRVLLLLFFALGKGVGSRVVGEWIADADAMLAKACVLVDAALIFFE